MTEKYNISFAKAQASGNDFVIINNLSGGLTRSDSDWSDLAKDICRRKYSIGADGLLVLEKSKKASFRMRIFNPDGSEVDMCGNGLRCSALYASVYGWGDSLTVETLAGILGAEINGGNISLKMSDPVDIKLGMNVGLGSKIIPVHYINTGVPHAVHIVEGLEEYPVVSTGRKIREHTLFVPAGTNVDFVGEITSGGAKIRTYERGVEDETLACGTGVVAAAVILGLLGYVTGRVRMKTRSGEVLTVRYNITGKKVQDVYLEGSANIVYEGRI